MADKEQIIGALEGLDPTDDSHWTTEGLPRLEVLQGMVGGKVTRDEVTKVAPKFNRDYPITDAPESVDPGEVDAGETSNEGQSEQDQDPQGGGDGSEGDLDDATAQELGANPQLSRDEYAEKVDGLTGEIARVEEALGEGNRYLAKLRDELDALYKERDAVFPPMKPAEAIQQFLAMQHQQRAARVLGHAKAQELVGAMPGPKSLLDQALFNRKRQSRG